MQLKTKILRSLLLFLWIYIASCIKTSATEIITMTLGGDQNNVKIGAAGSGKIIIDWGCTDTDITIYDLAESGENETITYYNFTYSNVVFPTRTINITGENITFLDCSALGLIDLDVSKYLALKALDCSINQLTVLNLKHNILLKELYCSNNKLTNLDVSHNPALEILYCNKNSFTELDISHNHHLKKLSYEEKNVKLIMNKNQIGQKQIIEKDFCEELQETALVFVEQPPEFEGNPEGLMKFITTKIIYPIDAQNGGIQGRVIVQFVITSEGKVRNVRTIRSVHPLLDEEAERVVKLTDKNWKPGFQDGKAVNFLYTIPIYFALQVDDDEELDETELDFLEIPPEFEGGLYGLLEFIINEIRYPESAIVSGIYGTVLVQFVVAEDGRVKDVAVVRGVHPLLDHEAVRVVKRTEGKWKPGMKNGIPVDVYYTVPLNFYLDDGYNMKKEKKKRKKEK